MTAKPASKLGAIFSWTMAATAGMRWRLVLASLAVFAATLTSQLTIQAISSIIRILQSSGSEAAQAGWDGITRIIHGLTGGGDGALVFLYGALVVAGILITFSARSYSAAIDYLMTHRMRGRIHRAMLDPLLFRTRKQGGNVGDRVSILERQAQGAQPMLREIFCLPITRILPLVTALTLLFLNLPDGGGQMITYLIVLAGMIASPVAGIWLAEKLRSGTANLENARSDLTGETILSATNPEILIGLGAVGTRQDEFDKSSQGVVAASSGMRVRQELSSQIQAAIVPFVQFSLIAYAVLAPGDAGTNLGAIFAIYMFVPQVINPVQEVVRFLTGAYQALPMIEKPGGYLLEKPLDLDAGETLPVERTTPARVRLGDLKVRGDAGKPPIIDVADIAIEGPGAVAVIGPSGAGKSTFLKAVARLNGYGDGEVMLQDADANRLSETAIRDYAGMAEQFPLLLDGSLATNLRLARPDAPDSDLLDAIALWNARAFLDKQGTEGHSGGENGLLDRLVQKDGRELFSGGERRIMALCRAALRDPHVLLLDEPTTGLDAGSVRSLAEATNAVKQDKLVLFVDHNLSFVAQVADRIIYLVKGKLDFDGDWRAFKTERADALLGLSKAEGKARDQAAPPKPGMMPPGMRPGGKPGGPPGKGPIMTTMTTKQG